MNWKRFLTMTAIVYSLNGSLDYVVNDDFGSAKAETRYYFLDYWINRDKPDYNPYIGLDWKTIKDFANP